MVFKFLNIPKREKKPRNNGLTSVLDHGFGLQKAKDLINTHEWIDIIKLGWGTPIICSEDFLKKKINLYIDNEIEVCNGGTLMEIAYSQNKVEEFLEKMNELGFTSIEVSNGKLDIDCEQKGGLIKKAKSYGFKVYSEVGKKDPNLDRKLCLEDRVMEARSDLNAGATKVIMEARSSGKLGVFNENCTIREEFAREIVKGIGLENIIFEAPQKNQQVWLILNFGPSVNFGNIKPDDVIPLETLRKGIRGDTFGKIY